MAGWRGRGRPLWVPGREERKLDANCSDETECLGLKAYTKGKYTIEHFATGALLLQTTACLPPLCPRFRLAAARESDTAY